MDEEWKTIRFRYFALTLLILAVSTLTACAQKPPVIAADLFFENGVIYTADALDTVAEVLAVKDGVIIFVGSADEGKPYRDGAAEIVDLRGGNLLPGLIDGHIHTITPEFYDFVHFADTSAQQILMTVAEYIASNPNQDTYYGFGFNVGVFEGDEAVKGPRKERLDEICGNKPIIILAMDGHTVWLNSKGFEHFGITADTPAPPGGEIVKDEAGGIWGTIFNSAISLVSDPQLSESRLSEVLLNYQAMLNSLGYTSIMTIPAEGYINVPWEGYSRLEQDGLLTLRVRGAGILRHWNFEEDFEQTKVLREKYNSSLVKLTAVKIFTDGIIGNKTAYLMEPYSGSEDFYGTAAWKQDDLNHAYKTANSEGYQVHNHVIGDAAVRMALDAAEYARGFSAGIDCRNVLTHILLVHEVDVPRFADLNVIPVVQPYWHFKQPGAWEPIEYPALGIRAEKEWPSKSFIENGATLVFSSDYPATTVPLPFVAIETAVTRNLPDGPLYSVPNDITDINDPGHLLWPEERLDIKDAIRAFTINAAYSIFADDVTGSLEVGKSADLIVTNQDLLSVDPLKISDTLVLRTYFNGKLVHLMTE